MSGPFGNHFAAKHTRFTLETDRTLESGESVRIYGMIVSNATASPVTIEILDATKVAGTPHFYIHRLRVPANDNDDFGTCWLADHGVKVMGVNDPDVEITFFHSHGGA